VSKAESLLYEMLNLAEAGNKNCAPDVICYNHDLSTTVKSGLPGDAQRVAKIVKTMNENVISHDQFTREALEKFTKGLGRSRGDR
jgi:hypothetical protein